MRTSWRRAGPVAILAATSFAALAAAAQERPPFSPTRDVAVTYRVENDKQPTNARLAWSAELRALRADLPAGTPASFGGIPLPPGAWVVVDLRAGRAFAADDRTGLVIDLPQLAVRAQAGERALAGARAHREGTSRVAGLPCTVWRLEPPARSPGRRSVRVCLTTDGVPLRAEEEGRRARAEATSIVYGPQNATRFQPPQGGITGKMSGTLNKALGGMLRGLLGPGP
ncbi:hypothetical protein [Dankookia rubra]|uniref:hypothetical protein n=1 Tax=Dankookia rubra TaxID=1442381 RepID=UPI00105864C9|nr:hypothetical protein [Dankookia rubra]